MATKPAAFKPFPTAATTKAPAAATPKAPGGKAPAGMGAPGAKVSPFGSKTAGPAFKKGGRVC